jgi:hypothetical protein
LKDRSSGIHACTLQKSNPALGYLNPNFSSPLFNFAHYPNSSNEMAPPRLNKVARQLNERPRETLQFEARAEGFNACVASTG